MIKFCWEYSVELFHRSKFRWKRGGVDDAQGKRSGVAQHPPPRLDILNQLPPVEVYTAELNKKFVPVLATDKICGSGFAPPAGMLKLMGFTARKHWFPP